jgi:hypothetical protein
MKTILRNGALALTLLAGSALVAAPAMADHDSGDWNHHWKKSWKKHGYYRHRHRDRGYAYHHRYPYSYYGWGWPGYYRPGFSLYIR